MNDIQRAIDESRITRKLRLGRQRTRFTVHNFEPSELKSLLEQVAKDQRDKTADALIKSGKIKKGSYWDNEIRNFAKVEYEYKEQA